MTERLSEGLEGVVPRWQKLRRADSGQARERFANLISTKTNRGVIASPWHIWLLLKRREGRNRVGVRCVCVLLEADTLHRVFQTRR